MYQNVQFSKIQSINLRWSWLLWLVCDSSFIYFSHFVRSLSRKAIFVHDGRRLAFCMRRIPKKKKKKLKDRNETKRCDWNVRQDERCCKTKRSLGNGQGKKTIACCSFQRAPSAAATRKTVHVSKIKATTTTAKKTENKSNQQRREDEWTNGGEFERVRRDWDCVTMKEKRMEKDTHDRWATSNSNNRKATIRKHCTIRSK